MDPELIMDVLDELGISKQEIDDVLKLQIVEAMSMSYALGTATTSSNNVVDVKVKQTLH